MMSQIDTLIQAYNELTRGWIDEVKATLSQLSGRVRSPAKHPCLCTHLVDAACVVLLWAQFGAEIALVTPIQLTEAIGKLLMFGLEKFIPIDLVYSSRHVGPSECLGDLVRRYKGSVFPKICAAQWPVLLSFRVMLADSGQTAPPLRWGPAQTFRPLLTACGSRSSMCTT